VRSELAAAAAAAPTVPWDVAALVAAAAWALRMLLRRHRLKLKLMQRRMCHRLKILLQWFKLLLLLLG